MGLRRDPHPLITALTSCGLIQYYLQFPVAILVHRVRYPSIPRPFATLISSEEPFAFDLHVLATPPAFVLSQDQTLHLIIVEPTEVGFRQCLAKAKS